MSVTLACAGYLDREASRLQRLAPQLVQAYEHIVLSVPPNTSAEILSAWKHQPSISIQVNPEWSRGRHASIEKSLETVSTHIHYADLDRVLHWAEAFPGEWQQTIEKIRQTDCLIIGRTERAFQTHPQALQQTERLVNAVFSQLLEKPVDLGGGSRGFSRRAAQFLIGHSVTQQAWCTDSEWVMLLHQAGFQIDFCAVDGLEAKTYPIEYDTDAKRWAFRVQLALEIVEAGIAANHRGKVD